MFYMRFSLSARQSLTPRNAYACVWGIIGDINYTYQSSSALEEAYLLVLIGKSTTKFI